MLVAVREAGRYQRPRGVAMERLGWGERQRVSELNYSSAPAAGRRTVLSPGQLMPRAPLQGQSGSGPHRGHITEGQGPSRPSKAGLTHTIRVGQKAPGWEKRWPWDGSPGGLEARGAQADAVAQLCEEQAGWPDSR